jgi:hypothetical protein
MRPCACRTRPEPAAPVGIIVMRFQCEQGLAEVVRQQARFGCVRIHFTPRSSTSTCSAMSVKVAGGMSAHAAKSELGTAVIRLTGDLGHPPTKTRSGSRGLTSAAARVASGLPPQWMCSSSLPGARLGVGQ